MGNCREALRGDCYAENVIEVTGLSYSYGGKNSHSRALDQVSFKLLPGRFYALLGPNGAGKSTLFALLTRLFVSRQGCIRFFGHDLSGSPAEALAHLGVVFQHSTLDLDLSVAQNLLYYGALHGLSVNSTRARLADELRRFGLQDRLKDKVRHLNGGHRRRLEIVRALLHRPRILLLDEPTVGLDVSSRQYLNARVRQLCVEHKLCVLWATHLLEEVGAEDQVMVLHQGAIKAQGRYDRLCAQLGVTDMAQAFHLLTGNAA